MTSPHQTDSDARPGVTAEMIDAISLEQALMDFEVANARVVDLTRRLTSLNQEFVASRTELETLRLHCRSVEAQLAEVRGSKAWRAARLAGDLRLRFGR